MKTPHRLIHQLWRLELQHLVRNIYLIKRIIKTIKASLLGTGTSILEHYRGIGPIDLLGGGIPIPLPTHKNNQ